MSQKTLKELFEFPLIVTAFTSGRKDIYAAVQYPREYEYLGGALQEWIQQALNEKAERDFSEPLRWELEYAIQDGIEVWWCKCPYCGCRTGQGLIYPYCPCCGKHTDQPEGSKEEKIGS